MTTKNKIKTRASACPRCGANNWRGESIHYKQNLQYLTMTMLWQECNNCNEPFWARWELDKGTWIVTEFSNT